MKNKEIIRFALDNFKNHKRRTIINIVIFSFSLVILILSSTFSETISGYIVGIREQPWMHIVTYTAHNKEEQLNVYNTYSKDPRIEEIGFGHLMLNTGRCMNTEALFGEEKYIGYNIDRFLNYFKQFSDYDKELGMYEAILPRYINAEDNKYWQRFFDVGEWFDTTSLVGKTISLEINYFDHDDDPNSNSPDLEMIDGVFEFKIVGTVDNVKLQDGHNSVFLSNDTLNDLLTSNGNEIPNTSLYLVVKDIDDIKKLQQEGRFNLALYLMDEVDQWDYMMDAVNMMGKILFVFCIFNVILSATRGITKRMSEFAILKAIGYEQKIINKMIASEIIFTFGAGMVFSTIISLLLIMLLNKIKYNVVPIMIAEGFVFSFELWHLLFSCVIVIVGIIIAYGFSIERITKTNLLKALKND